MTFFVDDDIVDDEIIVFVLMITKQPINIH